jgi:23S rRNA (guanosine2251-2'-O)-methyltransferase
MASTFLILDNIRSVHNVGSLFRTAETLGISKIYCVGTTPTPLDRFGIARKDFAKVSLGAETSVAWEYVEHADVLIKKLKKEKCTIVALEQSPHSVDYKNITIQGDTAIVLGNEAEGVSTSILESVDIIAEIPMAGKKESLNVSVAGAVFLYRLLDR